MLSAAGAEAEGGGASREPAAGARGAPRSPAGSPSRAVTLACLASFVGLGVLANLPAWLDGPTRTVQAAAQGDIGQEVWFLAWVPAAIAHGLDPLLTSWLNVPWGVNLMDNTSMPLAGLLGAPVTAAFGPIATYNVLFSLAFASSAGAAFLVLRRFAPFTPAAYVGGLLFGFSPYMVGQGKGHLFLVLVPALPVILWCLDEIVVVQRRRPVRMGVLLGLCAAAELGVSIELLAWAAVMAVVGIVVLAVVHRRSVAARASHAVRALASALAVFAAVAAFPLAVFFAGPGHVPGAVHPTPILAGLSADVTSPVVPTSNQLVSVGLAASGDRLVTLDDGPPVPDPAESGTYLGLPLVVLLAAGALRFRRDRTLRFALAMALVALVLSLGGRLKVGGHVTGVSLPFALLGHLGVLGGGVAARFAVFMWLFVALAVAVVVDRAHVARLDRADGARRGALRHARRAALGALLGASLVALLPAWPYGFGATLEPSWFASSAEQAVPAGSTLLAYPMARSSFSLGMVWQALDGFRYRIPAGEATVTNLHKSWLERVFDGCLFDKPNPRLDPTLVHRLRVDLRVRRVDTVVVPAVVAGSACTLRFLEAATGRPPVHEDGAWVWRGVVAILRP